MVGAVATIRWEMLGVEQILGASFPPPLDYFRKGWGRECGEQSPGLEGCAEAQATPLALSWCGAVALVGRLSFISHPERHVSGTFCIAAGRVRGNGGAQGGRCTALGWDTVHEEAASSAQQGEGWPGVLIGITVFDVVKFGPPP